jgi:aromatic ring hydroxylase
MRDSTTVVSPETGNRISWSYALPRSPEDLAAKYRNTRLWMHESWGQLGRIPDFMSNVVVGLVDFRDELESNGTGFGDNAVAYHRHASENDLALTHALGDPQIDRSASPLDDPDLALRIVKERDDGVVLRGAKQLGTLAPFAHEVLVYLSASFALRQSEAFVIWFALPTATRGLKLLCREPLAASAHGHGHPFASRFDEQDAMLFFDDVLVPWERVFLLHDGRLALRGLPRINAWAIHCTSIRFHERLRTLATLAQMIARTIGVDEFRNVQEKLGELIGYVRLHELATAGVEARPRVTPGGLYAPGDGFALGVWEADISRRVVELVRQVAASGLLMQPSEADLDEAELRPFLERYMRGKDVGVAEKSRLFRLAWDLTCDSFALRQELYEYLHRGDIDRNRMILHNTYDDADVRSRIEELIERPLPS